MSKIEMVVFDWAGTMVDYGSCAPVDVFDRTFKKKGIELTKEEINKPMGMEKKCHIRTILNFERVKMLFNELYNRDFTEKDVEELYDIFEKDLYEVVLEYTVAIYSVVETLNTLKEMGIKVGSTTGYTSAMMEKVTQKAKTIGIAPDVVITPDVANNASRPSPFMIFECMKKLSVESVANIIKVGDTKMDILEGKNAGVITVGLLEGSNMLGLSKDEYSKLTKSEQDELKLIAKQKYLDAGANFVINNMSELLDVIKAINFSA